MSAPTFTTHFLRTLFRELNGPDVVSTDGTAKMPFPAIDQNRSFARDYLLYNVARKRDLYEKGCEPLEVLRTSIGKWADSEHSCAVHNRYGKFFSLIHDSDVDRFERITRYASAHVSRILMDYWPDYDEASFTSGATNQTAREESRASLKWLGHVPSGSSMSVVPNAVDHLRAILDGNPSFVRRLFRKKWKLIDEDLVDSELSSDDVISEFKTDSSSVAVLDYVPKDTSSVRLIMKTGQGTMLVQSVFGKMIRKALSAEGVDLRDQSHNRDMALIGSYTSVIATVDLSSASDTISMRLCSLLLPPRVLSWLDSCRDTHVRVGKTEHRLQKFCSMGNGFCFELESLLFYAMTKAVCDELGVDSSTVNVYGDDIVAPSHCTVLLQEYFLYHGLFFNHEKSFSCPKGFRESCGGHYYNGLDVTPFYIKSELDSNTRVFHAANQLHEWSERTGIPVEKSLTMLINRIPAKERAYVTPLLASTAGFNFYKQGFSLPTRKWSKPFQRYVTTTTVTELVQKDNTARYCGRTLLMEWFMSAGTGDACLDKSIWRKLRYVPSGTVVTSWPTECGPSRPITHLTYRPHPVLYETKPVRIECVNQDRSIERRVKRST